VCAKPGPWVNESKKLPTAVFMGPTPCDIACAFSWPLVMANRGVIVVEPFRIHVSDEVLNDLRARLRNARWPDQIPGIGWEQGTELDWLRLCFAKMTSNFKINELPDRPVTLLPK